MGLFLMKTNSFERKQEILDLLNSKESVSVEELASLFSVTKVTIRTDLDELASKGLIVRTHGGASAPENKAIARIFTTTIKENAEEKKWIAAEAAKLISPGDSIIIDNGSTTVHLTKHLKGKEVTVATGSLLAINELMNEEPVELIVLGGMLRRFSMGTIGPMTRTCLEQFHANWLFLGATAVSAKDGITCSNLVEAETKKLMIETADKVCLMVDSSKFSQKAFGRICSWKDIDILITDRISDEDYAAISSHGAKIITKQRA